MQAVKVIAGLSISTRVQALTSPLNPAYIVPPSMTYHAMYPSVYFTQIIPV